MSESRSRLSSSSRTESSWQMPSSVLVLELELVVLLFDFWLSSVLALTKLSELSWTSAVTNNGRQARPESKVGEGRPVAHSTLLPWSVRCKLDDGCVVVQIVATVENRFRGTHVAGASAWG